MVKPRQVKKSKYRSTLEDAVVPQLLEEGGEYEPVSLVYQGAPRRYKPDVVLPNGLALEIKGWFTPADRAKTLAVLKQYPGLDLRFVLQRPETRLDGRSKTTNAMWCQAHKIRFCRATDSLALMAWAREPVNVVSKAILDAAPRVRKTAA